jgi:drug/metabolite transporter (DMT)-like permease
MSSPKHLHQNINKSIGLFFAILAAVGFSGKAILVKLAYSDGVDAISLLALRMAFSVPLFLIAAAWSQKNNESKVSGKDAILIVGLGILGYYLSSLFDFIGLQYISAGLERLILFLYPTIVVLISAVIFKKPIRPHQLGAMALGYSGIFLVYFHEDALMNSNLFIGALFVFISTLTYSSYLIGAGQVIQRVGAMRFTAYAMLVASIATFIQYVVTHEFDIHNQTTNIYFLSLVMAIFSTVFPVFLLSAAIKLIGAGNTSLIGSIGPVSTIVMADYFLNEPITIIQVFGSILVLAGVIWISFGAKSNTN